MIAQLRNQKGIALLESILATVLLSIGLTGGLFLMQNATRASLSTDFNIIASQLANEKLEMIIADKALKGGKYNDIIPSNYPNEFVSYNGDTDFFTRKIAILEVNANDLTTPQAGSGMKKVDVTVQWNIDTSKQIVVSTLVADY